MDLVGGVSNFTCDVFEHVGHIVGWQCRVLAEATTLRGLDISAQIWVRIGPCWGLLLCCCTLSKDEDGNM